MADKTAFRTDTLVHLPKYANAEMLTLEFFKNETFAISPKESTDDYTILQIFVHVDILDELIGYINANI